VTRISTAEARAMGLLPDKKLKPVRISSVKWDARLIPGGVWIQIPFVPPTLNVWKDWHWAKQGRYKKDLIAAVRGMVIAMRLPRYQRATVQIIYYHGTRRRRDPVDNYAPKFLMDALVKGGVLTDDNGDLVKVPTVGMEFDAVRPRTEVFIWERI